VKSVISDPFDAPYRQKTWRSVGASRGEVALLLPNLFNPSLFLYNPFTFLLRRKSTALETGDLLIVFQSLNE
jgi:hypothetical protein